MSSEGKELVLAQVMGSRRMSELYLVDLESEKVWRTPVATLLNEIGEGSIVRLQSVIYNVGGLFSEGRSNTSQGEHHIHNGASCLELSKEYLLPLLKEEDAHFDYDAPLQSKSGSGSGSQSIRWKDAPATDYERCFPSCAALGDKIFALGGTAPLKGLGEEFLPGSGWSLLAPTPDDLPLKRFCISSPVIPDEKNKLLLVHFFNVRAVYAYYPDKRKWECLFQNFTRWKRASVVVDGVLYSHIKGTPDCLVAYDVIKKVRLEVVYSEHFPVEVCISKFFNMLHLGSGMLCLANAAPIYRSLQTKLQFVKFSVKRSGDTEVHVTPGAISCFPLDNYLDVNHFIAL